MDPEHKISEEDLLVIQSVSYWLRGMNMDHRVPAEIRKDGVGRSDELDIIINRVANE